MVFWKSVMENNDTSRCRNPLAANDEAVERNENAEPILGNNLRPGLSVLGQGSARSAFTPYRPATVLTNLQRGNVQTQTPAVLLERSIHQLAAQGELFAHHLDDEPSIVDKQDKNGYSPLIWASAYGQLSTICLLLERGAKVGVIGSQGETALLFAAVNGHTRILKELLKYKADVHDTDEDGNTALMYAAYNNYALCAHELLQAGADLTHQNNNTDTAFDIAVTRGSKQVQAVLEKHMLNLLLNT